MTLWTVARQTPLFTGFLKREYWSGLPFLPPEDLPDPNIKLSSLLHCRQIVHPLSHQGSLEQFQSVFVTVSSVIPGNIPVT